MTTRNSVRALALAILFSASPAVAGAQDGWNLPIDRNRMIRAGETKSSSLDGGDRALGDGSYFEAWFFEGRAGQRVTVTMRSGAFDTFLAVGRHNVDVIETNDDYEANTSTNSQVSITLPADGMYVIRANSLEASKTGDYTLSLESGAGGGNGGGNTAGGTMAAARVLGMPVNNQRMLQSGRQVSGSLDASDGKLDDDSFFEVWYVQLSAGQKVTVTMRSGSFDTFLSIGAHQGNEAADTNDDFEENSTDSRLEFTANNAGTYVIIANSLESGKTGDYTLVAALSGGENVGGMAGDMIGGMSGSSKGSAPASNRVLTLGETRNSELTSDDSKLDDGSYYELWVFQGQAGSRVTITMRSSAFDAYLTIRDASGNELGKDDDSGGNTDAQVTITIPANGRFAIVANSLGADETGAYTIQVTRAQ